MKSSYDILFGDKLKMKECVERGKKLGILVSYHHSTIGKIYLLCSSCFDIVYESVEKWSEFIFTYIGFFKKIKPINVKRPDTTKLSEQLVHNVKMFENIWTGKGI